jgi:hypothetical protein
MPMTAGLAIWKLAFQLSPILLSGGAWQNLPGGVLPIIAITQAADFLTGLLSGAENVELDDFFAHFEPMPGATLVSNVVGHYPFANQAVAGNAIISQPLQLSMKMICPARDLLGYPAKLATMMALKKVLDQHNALGGTYTIITPSGFFPNGILLNLRDISDGRSNQPQYIWQWDFEFPLLTLETAQTVQNSMLNRLSSGSQVNATNGQVFWSGLTPQTGAPNSLTGPNIIPSAGALPAGNTSPFVPPTGGAFTGGFT